MGLRLNLKLIFVTFKCHPVGPSVTHYLSLSDSSGMRIDDPLLKFGTEKINKYLYNGKELVETKLGLNWHDYGARWYDGAVGRFTSVDPLAGEYTSVSPYGYVLNNPVLLTDPTGMGPEWEPKVDDDGVVSYTAEFMDNAETFARQFGISQRAAEAITGSTGRVPILEGTKVSGQKVMDVTGSEILRLSVNSNDYKPTDKQLAAQIIFAIRNEQFKDLYSHPDYRDYSIDFRDYLSDFSGKSSGGVGLTTSFNKMTDIEDSNGNSLKIRLTFRGGHDGLVSYSGNSKQLNDSQMKILYKSVTAKGNNYFPILRIYTPTEHYEKLYKYLNVKF